jgi:hypothetical protein
MRDFQNMDENEVTSYYQIAGKRLSAIFGVLC